MRTTQSPGLFAVAAISIFATCGDLGCAQGWNDPPPAPPGQMCDNVEIACPTQRGCCERGQTCGGEPTSVGCPARSCCPVGVGPMTARPGDGGLPPGARPMRMLP